MQTEEFWGDVLVTVRANGEERSYSLKDTINLDDARINSIALELYAWIRLGLHDNPGWVPVL